MVFVEQRIQVKNYILTIIFRYMYTSNTILNFFLSLFFLSNVWNMWRIHIYFNNWHVFTTLCNNNNCFIVTHHVILLLLNWIIFLIFYLLYIKTNNSIPNLNNFFRCRIILFNTKLINNYIKKIISYIAWVKN